MITKCMRYEIIKPTNSTWEQFGKILNDLRYKSARMGNYMIQLLWEWDNHRQQVKIETGNYPANSEQPNYYKLLRERFPDVGVDIINQTRQFVQNKYSHDRKDVFLLKKSIPSFRDNMPICIYNGAYIIRDLENSWEIDVRLLPKDALQNRYSFIVKTGERSKRTILEKINSGEYKQGMMQIIRDKRGKWYVIISYQFEPKEKEYKENRLMEVFLNENEEEALVIKINGTQYERKIPVDDIKHSISKFNARLNQLKEQKQYRGDGRKGHGRQKLVEPLQKIQDTQNNYKLTTNHRLSRIIIDNAIKQKCNEIIIHGDKWFIDWNIFDFKGKVKYKAKENGINYL